MFGLGDVSEFSDSHTTDIIRGAKIHIAQDGDILQSLVNFKRHRSCPIAIYLSFVLSQEDLLELLVAALPQRRQLPHRGGAPHLSGFFY